MERRWQVQRPRPARPRRARALLPQRVGGGAAGRGEVLRPPLRDRVDATGAGGPHRVPGFALIHCAPPPRPPRPDGGVAGGTASATMSTALSTRTATAMYCRPAFVYVTGKPVVGPGN